MNNKVSKKNDVTLVGLDIGYGVTKAVSEKGKSAIFPSVAGYARELKFQVSEISARHPGDMMTDDQGSWFVGDLALIQLREGEILRLRGGRTIDEIANAFRVRMMKVALGKLFPGLSNGDAVHISIATGLPVDHMPDAHKLKSVLIGQHAINTDQTSFVANVVDVAVMPQPYGTIYSKLLNRRGEIDIYYTHNRTGVIDVGTYTLDVAMDDDGEYIDSRSGSAESGVWLVQDAIAAAYERDFRAKPSIKTVEEIIRSGGHKLRIRGEAVDYSEVFAEAVLPLRDAATHLMDSKWQGGADLDVIWVSGGGAGLVIEDVRRQFSSAYLVDDFQLANAYGYLSYALFKKQEGG